MAKLQSLGPGTQRETPAQPWQGNSHKGTLHHQANTTVKTEALAGCCQEPWDNLTGNSHIPSTQCGSRSFAREERQGAESLIALALLGLETVWLRGRGNTSSWGRLENLAELGLPLLAGVSSGHRARAGAILGNQYTLAGVNRAWQGIWPEQGRGCSTIITARCLYWSIFFGMEEKIGTPPTCVWHQKKGARQTKLTTALWYWQHCCWHHHVDLLKIHCWCQQTTATALFYSGGQHQEMSLDRIFDMARSLAGKTVPL